MRLLTFLARGVEVDGFGEVVHGGFRGARPTLRW